MLINSDEVNLWLRLASLKQFEQLSWGEVYPLLLLVDPWDNPFKGTQTKCGSKKVNVNKNSEEVVG
jgi:hypothetical protein